MKSEKRVIKAVETRPGDRLIHPTTHVAVIIVNRRFLSATREHSFRCKTLAGIPARWFKVPAGGTLRVQREQW